MRRIVASFFISVDGVVETPDQWVFPYFDDAMDKIVGAAVHTTSAFLLGRRLYDEWSQYWPTKGPDDFAGFINAVDKYVVTSHPLDDPGWTNSTALIDDPAEQIRRLKLAGDGNIGMSGSATTVRWLMREGLIDELTLLVPPIAVGKGQRLFDDSGTVPLTLLSSETLPTGALHLRYQPVSASTSTDPTNSTHPTNPTDPNNPNKES